MESQRFNLTKAKKPRLLIVSGAGLSKESGLSTFRDSPDGMWENYNIDDVCLISNFMTNYDQVHKFYNERRVALGNVKPNDAHRFLVELEKKYSDDQYIHITANVDDLYERAGGTCMHLHGNLLEMVEPFEWEGYAVKNIGYTEYHPVDGIIAKPNVVMFGESWTYVNGRRQELYSEMEKVLQTLTPMDTAIIIGSSDTVIKWSLYLGMFSLAKTMNVNPIKHDNDDKFDVNVYKPVSEALDDIDEFVSERMGG